MLEPILCAPLIRKVDEQLLELLRSLTVAEWDLQTISPAWRVRDVAAHLLDTTLRKLSTVRDGWVAPLNATPADLAALVNDLNRQGVAVYRRLSPRVLLELMDLACRESADFHESLEPMAEAAFAVSWAGEMRSLNWFDTARELTERWHHQQQIRLATNRPGIMTPELYHPVLDCFLRGAPWAYRAIHAPEGTGIRIRITGDCGGTWFLVRGESAWTLEPHSERCDASVEMAQEIAWRIFTRGMSEEIARAVVTIEGDAALGGHILRVTSIVA